MEIRTIRAGGFAQAFAIPVLKAGLKVKLSNRLGPDSLRKIVNQLGPGVTAASSNEGTVIGTPQEGSGFWTRPTKGSWPMPLIDVYAVAGMFSNKHKLAQDLAKAVMEWEKVPPINLFKNNTAAFVHELPAEAISNAAGDGKSYVRVQVLTPVGVLDRDKQLGVVRELTDIVAAAASDPELASRTWVLITESPEGGWGIAGHANTGADIVAAARAELSKGNKQ